MEHIKIDTENYLSECDKRTFSDELFEKEYEKDLKIMRKLDLIIKLALAELENKIFLEVVTNLADEFNLQADIEAAQEKFFDDQQGSNFEE